MGRPKTHIEKITNCIVFSIDNNPNLAMKFAEYHIENWETMPCFRGGGLQGQTYYQVFFTEAEKMIDKFIEENKKETFKILKVNNFKDYKDA